jgi:hypothetical protein
MGATAASMRNRLDLCDFIGGLSYQTILTAN